VRVTSTHTLEGISICWIFSNYQKWVRGSEKLQVGLALVLAVLEVRVEGVTGAPPAMWLSGYHTEITLKHYF